MEIQQIVEWKIEYNLDLYRSFWWHLNLNLQLLQPGLDFSSRPNFK